MFSLKSTHLNLRIAHLVMVLELLILQLLFVQEEDFVGPSSFSGAHLLSTHLSSMIHLQVNVQRRQCLSLTLHSYKNSFNCTLY